MSTLQKRKRKTRSDNVRIVFMGTPDFAVETLKCLIDSKHDVVAVVTQPDQPKGRSKKLVPSPVKEAALKAKEGKNSEIKIYQPIKANDKRFIEELLNIKPDVIVVAAFGQILPAQIINLPKYGCINVHASLLPKLRGAAPIQRAIINGDKESGVTIMQMDEGLDTGDILLCRKCQIDDKETGGSLFKKLAVFGGPMVLEVLEMAENKTLKPVKQDDARHTYAKMLKKDMGDIDFNVPAKEIERLIRGLDPWPCAFTHIHGKTLKIWNADVLSDALAEKSGIAEKTAEAGTIISVRKNDIIVKTAKDYLIINSLQLEGKKRMETGAFLRGYKIEKGERFDKKN